MNSTTVVSFPASKDWEYRIDKQFEFKSFISSKSWSQIIYYVKKKKNTLFLSPLDPTPKAFNISGYRKITP